MKSSKKMNPEKQKPERRSWIDFVLFYQTLNKRQKTVPQLARKLNIAVSTLYRKINGESHFQLDEIAILKQELELTEEEAYRIFILGYLQQSA